MSWARERAGAVPAGNAARGRVCGRQRGSIQADRAAGFLEEAKGVMRRVEQKVVDARVVGDRWSVEVVVVVMMLLIVDQSLVLQRHSRSYFLLAATHLGR